MWIRNGCVIPKILLKKKKKKAWSSDLVLFINEKPWWRKEKPMPEEGETDQKTTHTKNKRHEPKSSD